MLFTMGQKVIVVLWICVEKKFIFRKNTLRKEGNNIKQTPSICDCGESVRTRSKGNKIKWRWFFLIKPQLTMSACSPKMNYIGIIFNYDRKRILVWLPMNAASAQFMDRGYDTVLPSKTVGNDFKPMSDSKDKGFIRLKLTFLYYLILYRFLWKHSLFGLPIQHRNKPN